MPSNPRLTSAIFIDDMFHTIAEVTSISFDLRRQIFAEAKKKKKKKKIELERLLMPLKTSSRFSHTATK